MGGRGSTSNSGKRTSQIKDVLFPLSSNKRYGMKGDKPEKITNKNVKSLFPFSEDTRARMQESLIAAGHTGNGRYLKEGDPELIDALARDQVRLQESRGMKPNPSSIFTYAENLVRYQNAQRDLRAIDKVLKKGGWSEDEANFLKKMRDAVQSDADSKKSMGSYFKQLSKWQK